jgi:NAD(P)-dependent dehydrogenase (short-subunit alcohol dehydrogenase family)
MSLDFSSRRILVTGAARGIGLASVERFVAGGARVACLDRDPDALAALSGSPMLHALVVDVADPLAVTEAIDKAAALLGGIDGVVNAAGLDLVAPIEIMRDTDWDRLMAVNLTGPMLVCRAAFPFLRKAGGGTIVNVSSGAGLQPLKHRTAYSASKAGLQMFSKALAMEAAEFGIRVNAVCPGAVETDLFRSSLSDATDQDAQLQSVRDRYALARIASPDEIAAAIVWLSSPEASFVTGTAIAVDGGRTFH